MAQRGRTLAASDTGVNPTYEGADSKKECDNVFQNAGPATYFGQEVFRAEPSGALICQLTFYTDPNRAHGNGQTSDLTIYVRASSGAEDRGRQVCFNIQHSD